VDRAGLLRFVGKGRVNGKVVKDVLAEMPSHRTGDMGHISPA
jgi:hypothetical protein